MIKYLITHKANQLLRIPSSHRVTENKCKYNINYKKHDEIEDLFVNDNDPEQVDLIKQYNSLKKERKNVENNQRLLENRI